MVASFENNEDSDVKGGRPEALSKEELLNAIRRWRTESPTELAEKLNISRITVWRRLKEIPKEEIEQIMKVISKEQLKLSQKMPFHAANSTCLIGEALVGRNAEVAHIDLMIGDKTGLVGNAFANSLANPTLGHTPLLAVIRPNLPPKPFTLIVPKVTVKSAEQIDVIFGPAQAAVAKAVADAVEEGIIPAERADDSVIICSVFVHPDAKDLRRIYHYNYSATKLALMRAINNYPPLEKIMYDKDRAKHPIMGFRVPRLWMPPYLQIALDIPDLEATEKIIAELPESDRIILEAGTPLIKRYGVRVIRDLREVSRDDEKAARDKFIVADLKTLDVGQVEVDLAFEETADAVIASGLASKDTLDKFIYESKRLGIYSYVDMMDVRNPIEVLKSLNDLPEVIIIHRGIDEEHVKKTRWELIEELKRTFKEKKILVAVAGGIDPTSVKKALESGADILVVGRYITQSKDVRRSVRELVEQIGLDMDLFRIHVE